jgi:hypothetical protein
MHALRWSLALLVVSLVPPFCHPAYAGNGGAAIAVSAGPVTRVPALVAPQSDSGAIVIHAGIQSSQIEIRAQRVDRRGRTLWNLLLGGNDLNNSIGGMIADGTGGVLYAWAENRGATGLDIIVQRVMPNGTLAYGPTGLVVCNASRDQTGPQLVLGPNGSFYVIWSDDRPAIVSQTDFYAQRVTLAGATVWAAINGVLVTPAANRPYAMNYPQVISDAQGGVITWWRNLSGPERAQRVNSAGTLQWVATAPTINVTQDYFSDLTPDGSGGAWVLGIDNIGADFRLNLQHLSLTGTNMIAGNGVQGDYSYNGWTEWNGVRTSSGGLWVFSARSTGTGVRRQFDTMGLPVGTDQYLDPRPMEFRLFDVGTGFITTSAFQPSPSSPRCLLRVQRHAYDGTAVFSGMGVFPGREEPSLAISYAFAAAMGGGAVVAFSDGRYSTPYDASRLNLFGQAYDADGNPLWDDGEAPTIVAAADAPNDQGGRVRVTWHSGVADLPVQVVREYRVWRALPDAPPGMTRARPAEDGEFVVHGRRILYRSSLFWEMAASQPAAGLASYALSAPTGQDSISGNSADMSFMVEAVDDSSHHWWTSVKVAHSVDNLPPGALLNVTGHYAGGATTLGWDASDATDLSCYEIFRGHSPTFIASDANRIATTLDLDYVDPASPSYYRVAARDVHGNRGPAALVVPTGVVDVTGAPPLAWSLRARWDRGNGALALTLDVPRADHGRVELFDVAGRRLWSARFHADHATALVMRVPAASARLAQGLVIARVKAESGPVLTARTMVVR